MKWLMVLVCVLAGLNLDLGAATEAPAVVHVHGAVYKPGPVPLPRDRPLTTEEAIRLAGGASRTANLTRVRVSRKNAQGEWTYLELDVQAIMRGQAGANDVPLQEGDAVYLSERCFG